MNPQDILKIDDVVTIPEDTFVHWIQLFDEKERRILKKDEKMPLKEVLVHSFKMASNIAMKIKVSRFEKMLSGEFQEENEKFNKDLKSVMNIFTENFKKLSDVDRSIMWGAIIKIIKNNGYWAARNYLDESFYFVGSESRDERFTNIEIDGHYNNQKEYWKYVYDELGEKNIRLSFSLLKGLKEMTVDNPGLMNVWFEPRGDFWLKDNFNNDMEMYGFLSQQKMVTSIFMSKEAEKKYNSFLEKLKVRAFPDVLEKIKTGTLKSELTRAIEDGEVIETFNGWQNYQKKSVFIKEFENYLKKPYLTSGGETFSTMLNKIGCNNDFLEKIEKNILSNNLFEVRDIEESNYVELVMNKEVALKIMLLNDSQYYDLRENNDLQFSNVLEDIEIDDKEIRDDFNFRKLSDILGKLSRVVHRESLSAQDGTLLDYEKDGGVGASNDVKNMRVSLRNTVDELFKKRLSVFYSLVSESGFKIKELEGEKNELKVFATEEILVEKEDVEIIKDVLKKTISLKESKLQQYLNDLSILHTEKVMKNDLEKLGTESSSKMKVRKF